MRGLISNAVSVLQLIFVCASVVSYVAFVLSLFVPHLFFLSCLGMAVFHDCGHYENTPIQIYRKFHLQKLKIFR